MREVDPANRQDLRTIGQLHTELLDFGPIAGLGEFFAREIYYGVHLRDNVMRLALSEVAGHPAGFIGYTTHWVTFHRSVIRHHLGYALSVLAISIVRDPRRLLRLLSAMRAALSYRAEPTPPGDLVGNVVALAVRPEFVSPHFVRRTGLRVGDELVAYAASYFQRAGMERMRITFVDADNKAALLFYHRLGGRFERHDRAGTPVFHVWFDLNRKQEPMHVNATHNDRD